MRTTTSTLQALNTIGIELESSDSDMAVQVKAISLKALNQPKRALEQFEELFKRQPNPYLAYELADLKIQTGNNAGAVTNVEYGIAQRERRHDIRFLRAAATL